MTPPTAYVISPAPGLRTRHDWVIISMRGDERLSAVVIWLPGVATWLRSTALTLVLNTTRVGPYPIYCADGQSVFATSDSIHNNKAIGRHLSSVCFQTTTARRQGNGHGELISHAVRSRSTTRGAGGALHMELCAAADRWTGRTLGDPRSRTGSVQNSLPGSAVLKLVPQHVGWLEPN
jgi:hypothetical protein